MLAAACRSASADVARLGRLEVAQDLGDAERAHRQHGEVDAVGELRNAEREALLAGLDVLPTVESSSPNTIMMTAFRIEPRASTTASASPNTISPKYSAGPKRSASRVSGAPSAAMTSVATVPAKNDAIAAVPSAMPACPRRAIWWPSSAVTTLVASPGILMRIAVVEPPYCAP